MAEKRMFAKTIIDSDAFLDMPLSSQALYFHLSMRADDEGFINNPRKIQRTIGSSDDDLKLLIAKNFIIPFASGVVVIKHWWIHNYIRKDRVQNTVYQEEKSQLSLKENSSYTLCQSDFSQLSDTCQTDGSIDKIRLDKIRLDKINIPTSPAASTKHKYGEHKNVLLTDNEVDKLKARFSDWEKRIENLSTGIALKGYKYKSHYLAILKWAEKDEDQKPKERVYERGEYSL